MNNKQRLFQWASIVMLLAGWKILGIADANGYSYLHPLGWFGLILCVYSALVFIAAPKFVFEVQNE